MDEACEEIQEAAVLPEVDAQEEKQRPPLTAFLGKRDHFILLLTFEKSLVKHRGTLQLVIGHWCTPNVSHYANR